jgi:hypothetical protein
MKKEEELCEGWGTRWWLNTEDSTDLWSEKLLLYEIDLFTRSEVDRGSLDRIGSHTQPRTEYGGVSRRGVMLMLCHVGG